MYKSIYDCFHNVCSSFNVKICVYYLVDIVMSKQDVCIIESLKNGRVFK